MPMDSPFSNHLDSDYSPSDAEILLIKALVQQKLDAVGSIDKEIKDFEDSLATLKTQRRANEIFVQRHRVLIAPIKRLSPKILSTIFLACLPAIERPEASMASSHHPAVVISHVCRLWRQVTFDTPLLWSRIQMNIPSVICDHPYSRPSAPANDELEADLNEITSLFNSFVQRITDTTAIWLSRSKGCPLTIFMDASEDTSGVYVPSHLPIQVEGSILVGLGKLVDLLLSESKRWEQVRFKLSIKGNSPQTQLGRLLSLTPQDVPILQQASIVINPLETIQPFGHMLPHTPQDVPILSDVIDPLETRKVQRAAESNPTNFWDGLKIGTVHGQALQSLTLDCPKAATRLKVFQVNWAGLTELSLRPYTCSPSGRRGETHLTTNEALTLLRLCPNLKRCNLHIGNGSIALWLATPPPKATPVQLQGPVCRLPHLHSFILREGRRVDSLVSALDLPSLHSLTTKSVLWSRPPSSDPEEIVWQKEIPLVGWAQRFGQTITSVDFEHFGVPQRAVEKSLEDLPNLISLTIRSPFTESLSSTSLWVVSGCDSFLQRLTPKVIQDGSTVTVIPGFLCPKLEKLVLNSTHGNADESTPQLLFNEAGVMEFLTGRAKASLETVPKASRVPKVRYVSAGFAKPKVTDIGQELSRRGFNLEGFVGEWRYPVPRRPEPRVWLQPPPIPVGHLGSMDGF